MNKDEQLVVQVLNAYKNGKIDFSNVPELDRLVRQEVNKDFRDYQEKIEAVANQKIESAIQEQLHRLEAEQLKVDILKEIQVEKEFKLKDFEVGFVASGKLSFKHVKGGVILVETDFTIKEEKTKTIIEKFK